MADSSGYSNESREDVLHVPNLFEFFCMRTSEDMRARGSNNEPPTISFASLIITVLTAFAFYVFGRTQLAKATFILFGLLLLWTVWGVVVRSSEQLTQKADDIKSGSFPPASAPFVIARLKWWNHLVVPLRWGKHSRLYDRRAKLERRIEEIERKIADTLASNPPAQPYAPPTDSEVADFAETIHNYKERNDYEMLNARQEGEINRLRGDLLLHKALLIRLGVMADKLDKIEKLTVVFHNVSPADLSQVVSEATQMLEERRILVIDVDAIDPDDFIDLVTVRTQA